MTKHKAPMSFKVGGVIYVCVEDEHVQESDPCDKSNCMLTRAFSDYLVKTYGGKHSDYKVKSTNHGCIFELNGRRYVAVFDTRTARKIYVYDQTFRDTKSAAKARAGVRPFKTRILIESSSKVAAKSAMTTEVKKHLRSLPRPKRDVPYTPKTTGFRRELSL